jgi:hypothetical protein
MERHLRLRAEGELEEDLRVNYHPEVIVLTARKVFRGHDGIRESAHHLWAALPNGGGYSYDSVLVDDRFALLEWRGKTDDLNVECGVDSYVIEHGLIVAQSIHYRVLHVGLSVAASALAAPGEVGPISVNDRTRMHHVITDGRVTPGSAG